MEKKKIDLNTEKYFEETKTIQDKNGNAVDILKRIPYEQKEALVQELAAMAQVEDEETGTCYVSSLFDLIYNFLFVKYYTSVDTEGMNEVADFQKLYDYCQANEMAVCQTIERDEWLIIDHLWEGYKEAVITLYERQHSLGQVVKQLMNTDVDTTNAETRELIEKLIDMKGALTEKEEQGKVLEFGKKKTASVKTGGVKVNLGKR